MSFDMQVEIRDSFYKKVLPETYKNALTEGIKAGTLKAEAECKKEAPVITGNLRRGHSSNVNQNSGEVVNSMEYWTYVVYGHHSYTGNNYPQRALNTVLSTNTINKAITNYLKNQGVL